MLKDKNLISCLAYALAGIVLSIVFFSNPLHDFGNYYFGSKFALQGVNIHDIYEPYRFNLLIRNLPGFQDLKFLYNYAVVPPFTLLCYLPFTVTDVYTSKLLFNIISVLVFSFSLLKLLRHLKIVSPLVLLLPILLFIPFRNNILFGQTYLLLAGFLMAGFVAEEKNKNKMAAIFYALSIALKISPAILLLYMLARKNYKAFSMTILFSSIFFLSSVYFTGWEFMKQYILEFIPRMSINEINNPWATTYQSITVLLRNFFIHDKLLNPAAVFSSVYNDYRVSYSILSGLITGILFFFFAKQLIKDKDHFSIFSFTLLSGCLFTAYTSSYSLVFLLPLCIASIIDKESRLIIVFTLTFLVCAVPVSSFQSFPILLRFPRLYMLLLLFIVICMKHTYATRDLKFLVMSVAVFVSINYLTSKRSDDKSEYYLDKEISLLGYDFSFRGKELTLKFIDENGPFEKTIALTDSIRTAEPLTLINNQVFFHGQLIAGNDNKLNPVLLNNKEIVYMSDQNRGIGFYALRKISVYYP